MRFRIGVVQSTSSVDFLGMDIIGDWFAIAMLDDVAAVTAVGCDCLARAWEPNSLAGGAVRTSYLNIHVVCAKANLK